MYLKNIKLILFVHNRYTCFITNANQHLIHNKYIPALSISKNNKEYCSAEIKAINILRTNLKLFYPTR